MRPQVDRPNRSWQPLCVDLNYAEFSVRLVVLLRGRVDNKTSTPRHSLRSPPVGASGSNEPDWVLNDWHPSSKHTVAMLWLLSRIGSAAHGGEPWTVPSTRNFAQVFKLPCDEESHRTCDGRNLRI